jgi:hypothetical protein
VRTLALIAGLLFTAGVTITAVASMVVPRATRSGLAHVVTRGVTAVMRLPLRLLRDYRSQDRWLRLAAPISVMVQLAVFVFLIIIGVALVVFGQFDLTWKQAAWQGAATVTTLGVTEAVNWSSAMTAAVGAFLGLVIIAVFMGYLVGLYSAYVARESLMARFAQVGGEPNWGPMVLARSQLLAGDPTDALKWDDWSTWMTDVRLGQQASPVLAHFRSPDPRRHWTVSLLSMLDATALALALGELPAPASAVRCLAEGTITLGVLHRPGLDEEQTNWTIEQQVLELLDGPATAAGAVSEAGAGAIGDGEWAAAADLLTSSGVATTDQLASCRPVVEALRSLYAADAHALAATLHAVRAPWSGDRHTPTPVLWPHGPRGWHAPTGVAT